MIRVVAALLIVGASYVAVNWLRGGLGVTWLQLGALTFAALVVTSAVATLLRRRRSRAKPDLTIVYLVLPDRFPTLAITVTQVDLAARGMLQTVTGIQAWCHRRHKIESFELERISTAAPPGQPHGRFARDALLALVRCKPEVVRQQLELTVRDDVWPRNAVGETLARPTDILLRRTGNLASFGITMTEVVRDRTGLIFGVRGRDAVTHRMSTVLLWEVEQIVFADTGLFIDVIDVQRWLSDLCSPPANRATRAASWTAPAMGVIDWAWGTSGICAMLAIGTILANGLSQPRSRYVADPVVPIPTAISGPQQAALSSVASTQFGKNDPPIDDTSAPGPFSQGLTDRTVWEDWLNQQAGEGHRGALWWASQRSLARPGSCYGPMSGSSGDFTAGCVAAQQRLTRPDQRRRVEPDYRAGWNSYRQAASASANAGDRGADLPSQPSDNPHNAAPPSIDADIVRDIFRDLGLARRCSLIVIGGPLDSQLTAAWQRTIRLLALPERNRAIDASEHGIADADAAVRGNQSSACNELSPAARQRLRDVAAGRRSFVQP